MANKIVDRHICVHSHRSIQELTAQTNDLTRGTQNIQRNILQLQKSNLGTVQGIQNLQAASERMAAVQGVLPLEIRNLVRNAVAEELRSASQDQQTLSNEAFRKQALSLNSGIQYILPLERPSMVSTSPKLDNTSDLQSFEQFQEMEKDLLLPYQNQNDSTTAFPSKMQEQRPYVESKILMFSWYYRAFMGYFSVVVSERHQVTAGREENVLHIDIRIFPWRWICSWGFCARILYDRTHGLSSPTNIHLHFPRIIPMPLMNEGIWRLFCERKSDSIIDNIRSGVYRPDDLFEIIGCPGGGFERFGGNCEGPTSLLTVSSLSHLRVEEVYAKNLKIASIFGNVKVVRFLLQQGARIDQSDYHVPGIPRSESDLYSALVPSSWWILWELHAVHLIVTEDRLDTARLLINAGSDLDSIPIPALLMWAIEWDLETILGVVGNRDNFHWDAIHLGFMGSDLSLAFPCIDPSEFERFFELCRRLKIDLSFTQPNGMTLLHLIINSVFVGQINHLKHYLNMLVTNGVDPCAVCDGYLTPTLMAFLVDKLDPWFTVLRQTGISVEAVAAHALGLLTESTMQDIIKSWAGQDRGLAMFEDIKQLRVALIKECEGQGCYLTESGDRGNMVTYKASSSVDFKPSTVYDPERANRDFRRRTEGQKHPQ